MRNLLNYRQLIVLFVFSFVPLVSKSQFLGQDKKSVKTELTAGKDLYVVDWIEREKESTIVYKDKKNPDEINTCYFHQYGICSSMIKKLPNAYLKTYIEVFDKSYKKVKDNEWVSSTTSKTFVRLLKQKDFFTITLSFE